MDNRQRRSKTHRRNRIFSLERSQNQELLLPVRPLGCPRTQSLLRLWLQVLIHLLRLPSWSSLRARYMVASQVEAAVEARGEVQPRFDLQWRSLVPCISDCEFVDEFGV